MQDHQHFLVQVARQLERTDQNLLRVREGEVVSATSRERKRRQGDTFASCSNFLFPSDCLQRA